VAGASGFTVDETTRLLGDLAARGLVSKKSGSFGGWALTDEGRVTGQCWLDEELASAGANDVVHRCYDAFLKLNPLLLEVSTDWQMVPVGDSHIVNDHRDSGYDARVLDRLIKLDDKAQRICTDLSSVLSRFSPYGPRLSTALERALAGEDAYVTDNLESYHNVWFQLHEDLLVTLGISRGDERWPAPPSPSGG
jgi:hypothetical protein